MIVDDLWALLVMIITIRREAFDDQNFECYCTLLPSVLADNTDLASLCSSPIRGILNNVLSREHFTFGLPCIMMCSRIQIGTVRPDRRALTRL
jgi:hypothetical protein